MNPATTKSMMHWTHIREQPSWIPVTRTSRRGCSFFEVAAPALGLRLVLRSQPTSIPMLINLLPLPVRRQRSGTRLPNNSSRPRRHPRDPPAHRPMVGADITRSTLLPSPRTPMSNSAARPTAARGPLRTQPRCKGSPALGRSSRCASSSKLLHHPLLQRLGRSPRRVDRPTRKRVVLTPGRQALCNAGALPGLILLCRDRRRRLRRRRPHNRCTWRGA